MPASKRTDNYTVNTPHIILIGGGGHAKVILDAANAANIEVQGFVDDLPDAPLSTMRSSPTYAGTSDEITNQTQCQPILAIGNLQRRELFIDQLDRVTFAKPIIHPSAIIAQSASIALGAFVAPGAIINADAKICSHAIINTGSIIEHDCRVGINTHIAPRAPLGGGVQVGNHTLVGIGATVLPGIKIGSRCTIGAGAVVTQDVQDGETVVGVPAKAIQIGSVV